MEFVHVSGVVADEFRCNGELLGLLWVPIHAGLIFQLWCFWMVTLNLGGGF